MAYQQDFTYVEGAEPHRHRTKDIITAHPEVKDLIGKNPMTMALSPTPMALRASLRGERTAASTPLGMSTTREAPNPSRIDSRASSGETAMIRRVR